MLARYLWLAIGILLYTLAILLVIMNLNPYWNFPIAVLWSFLIFSDLIIIRRNRESK